MSVDPSDVQALVVEAVRALKDRRRRDASAIVAELQSRADVVLTVESLAASSDAVERELAARIAGGMSEQEGARALLRILDDEDDPAVLEAVAQGLYGIRTDAALRALLRLIGERDAATQDWAAWALADNFPPTEPRNVALRRWLASRDESQLSSQVLRALDDPVEGERPAMPSRVKKAAGARSTTLRVLVVSANPTETDVLALDEEVRGITHALRSTPGRDAVLVESAWAARPLDLLNELNEREPDVLHFSGHGMPNGSLVFVDESGSPRPVSAQAIVSAIRSAGPSVRVVVLNACFSEPVARALVEYVEAAVGMNSPIGDEAAQVFAGAFYAALGYGHSVERAFDQGKAALDLEGIDEAGTPELVTAAGVIASELMLVRPRSRTGDVQHSDREALRRATSEHLTHIDRHAVLPLGGGVTIARDVHGDLVEALSGGSTLVVGDPGSGKSGALARLARELRDAGRDVVVLAADLLGASGPRGLADELGIESGVYEALSSWSGSEPAYLLIDALDAARGVEAFGTLLSVAERVAGRKGRWRVVLSIRTFDLRHNAELRDAFPRRTGESGKASEFARVQHVLVGPLTQAEIAQVTAQSVALASFLGAAPVAVNELIRVPFNLSLVARIFDAEPDQAAALSHVRTQLELLNLYWQRRVVEPPAGRDARELVAQAVCDQAVQRLRLQVPRSTLREVGGASEGLHELLAAGVLIESTPSEAGPERVAFAHHVLFDYALQRLLFDGDPNDVATRLAEDDQIVFLARPSLKMLLDTLWLNDPTRQVFWRYAMRLAASDQPAGSRLVAAAVAAERTASALDLAPLISRNVGELDAAGFLLRHIVRAATANAPVGRPLANAQLDVWAGVAEAICEYFSAARAYPLRILVWGLAEEVQRLAPEARRQLAHSARTLLTWALDTPNAMEADVGVGIQAVSLTADQAPELATPLLARVLDRDRIDLHGASEIRRLVEYAGPLARTVPALPIEMYRLAFGRDETSVEKTAFGPGQIMRLTSTRRQDWDMNRYSLGQHFPEVLDFPSVAIEALSSAAKSESRDWTKGQSVAINVLGVASTITGDGSNYWDHPGRHRVAVKMLDDFENHIVESGERGDQAGLELIRAAAMDDRPAAVWRRVLVAASRSPRTIGEPLAGLICDPAVWKMHDLTDQLSAALVAVYSDLDADHQVAAERVVLELPDPQRAPIWASLPQGALHLDDAITQQREALDVSASAAGLANDDADTWTPADQERDSLRFRGIDPDNKDDAHVLDLITPVKEFVSACLNRAPTLDEADAVVPHLEALRAVGAMAGVSSRLRDEAEAWLAEAAAAIVTMDPLLRSLPAVQLARDLALSGANGCWPEGAVSIAEFDERTPSWGVPSGRVDAARALLLLSRNAELGDAAVRVAISRLSDDPQPIVRWSIAHSLPVADGGEDDWAWGIAVKLFTTDPSAQVRAAVLPAIGRQVERRGADTLALVAGVLEHERASGRMDEHLVQECVAFLVGFWIWHGYPQGRHLVDTWLKDIERHTTEVDRVFFLLRKPVTSEPDGGVRERSLTLWADITEALFVQFSAIIASGQAGASETAPEIGKLLDESATELYFASGAYDETRGGQDADRERLTPAARSRFYREAETLIDVHTKIGVPSAAHHVLETLATFVDEDPAGVLVRVGRLLEAGRDWGYQSESLAEREFVALIERYLAGHRDLLLRDKPARTVLSRAIEGFVEAGWPSAVRLLYGLDDMFR